MGLATVLVATATIGVGFEMSGALAETSPAGPVACHGTDPHPGATHHSEGQIAPCLPKLTVDHYEESVCLFLYIETSLSLADYRSCPQHGHPNSANGTFDGVPETGGQMAPNSSLTEDFDPNSGESGDTRIECTDAWSSSGSQVLTVSFNYGEFSSPATFVLTATVSAGFANSVRAVVSTDNGSPKMANVTLCNLPDEICNGDYPCGDGSGCMSFEFGSPSAAPASSPELSQVTIPGPHDDSRRLRPDSTRTDLLRGCFGLAQLRADRGSASGNDAGESGLRAG